VGVAPERIDRLVGAARPVTIPPALLVAAGVPLAGIATLALTMLLADWHLEAAALLAACVPACLAARRAGASLRPMA